MWQSSAIGPRNSPLAMSLALRPPVRHGLGSTGPPEPATEPSSSTLQGMAHLLAARISWVKNQSLVIGSSSRTVARTQETIMMLNSIAKCCLLTIATAVLVAAQITSTTQFGSISGRVLSDTGIPVSGALVRYVRVAPISPLPASMSSTLTAQDGSYTLAGLPPG